MKKYLTEFTTEELYTQFKNSADYVTPNVSLIKSIQRFMYEKDVNTQLFLINGVEHNEKVITLTAGNTYVMEGVHTGQIIIDAKTSKPDTDTIIRLNGVTILSDESYGIMYTTPAQDGNSDKGYGGMDIILEKDSHNFIVCEKSEAVEGDAQMAALNSWKTLSIQGIGYLALYNNVGHGARGTKFNIAGPHIYADVEHDAIHGKNVYLLDGLVYIKKAKDGIGTSDEGAINIFGGSVEIETVTQDAFDSKTTGYFVDETVFGNYSHTNIVSIEQAYETGSVIGFNEANPNGVEISVTEITEKKYVNSGDGTPVLAETTDPATILTTGYDLTGYTSVTVSGKILYPLVFPLHAQIPTTNTNGEYVWSSKGKLKTYTGKIDILLNNTYIKTNADYPAIYYGLDVSRVKLTSVKDTINLIDNTYNGEGIGDHDAIKSENNINMEVKNDSILYVTSYLGDGIDGGDVKITDSKGTLIVEDCGERGIKGNAIVIGPNAKIESSVITHYYTSVEDAAIDDESYTTFDGIAIVKNNCQVKSASNGVITSEDPESKLTGFADIYARNGKHTKGVFGTTDAELNGIIITGSIGAVINIDMGNTKNLYYKSTFKAAANSIGVTTEEYKVVPYNAEPIAYSI